MISIEAFKAFKERFDDIQIGRVISDYQRICKSFEDLQEMVQVSSEAGDHKLKAYEKMQSSAEAAMDHLKLFDSMKEELKKAQSDARKAELERQRNYRLKLAGIVVSGVVAIVGILTLL